MRLTSVTAELRYTADTDELLDQFLYDPDPGTPMNLPEEDIRAMPIYNARDLDGNPKLDREGFHLSPIRSQVSDFWDQEQVASTYYAEICGLVKDVTGAKEVRAFDHNVRNKSISEQNTLARKPVKYVHNDYTDLSGPQRVQELYPHEAGELLERRYAFINVWKPTKRPVEESPLGVCDARSMIPDDFLPTALRYRDRTGQVYSVRHNADHQWFYYPQMQAEEALLLKCFDSLENGIARYTAHSAFIDPTSPEGSAPRESIEVRTIAFF